MLSLSERRNARCAGFALGLIRGDIDCSFLLSRMMIHVPRVSARYSRTFMLPASRSNALARTPLYVMCKNADALMNDIFDR